MNCSTVRFDNGNPAAIMRAAKDTPIGGDRSPRWRCRAPRGVLILNGGTAELAADLAAQLGAVLQDGLARVAAEDHLTVITGGTDAGVFHLFGEGLARWGRTAPCIGVAVAALVSYPGHPGGEAPLEPNHSHFVLTAGRQWGDETATMYALAAALARDCPSLAVFAGGGEIALREMQANVAQGRAMLLLAGSGRNTDAVLAAAAGEPSGNADLDAVARYPGIVPAAIADDPAQLRATVRRLLFGGEKPAG